MRSVSEERAAVKEGEVVWRALGKVMEDSETQWRSPVRAWIASKSFVSLNLAFTVRKKKGGWSTKKTPPYQPPEAAVRG